MSKKKATREISTSKQFTYQNDGVVLSFTLNIDNTSQLSKFKVLLGLALEDIESLLEEMKK